jgi:hypothetical protein
VIAIKKDECNRRHHFYEDLLTVAAKELALIQTENFGDEKSLTQLNYLLEDRRQLINCIDEINKNYPELSMQEREIIEKIIEMDMSSRAEIETKKSLVWNQLRKLKEGKRTAKAYQPETIQFEGFFIDSKK